MTRALVLFVLSLGLVAMPAHPPAAPAAAKKGGKAAKPKRHAPKPHHARPAKVRPKGAHHARHAPGHATSTKPIKTKKAAPKPKHTLQPKAKPKIHNQAAQHFRKDDKAHHAADRAKLKTNEERAKFDRERQRARSVEHETRLLDHRHARLVERTQAWSRTSTHESSWWHYHWHTHHFATFVGAGTAAAAYHFSNYWWNSYVVHRGTPGWSTVVATGPGGDDGSVTVATSAAAPPADARPAPVVKADQPFPLSPQGIALARLLDELQVETHWLPGQSVDWRTGTPTNPGETGPASNGGAFLAAACDRLGAPLPADDPTDFLPASQIEWLMSVGKNKGWVKVGEVEGQVLANQGWVVIATWKNLAPAAEREIAGQLAVVRPDREAAAEVGAHGPRVAIAGLTNRNDTTVKDGFPSGAWREQEVVYLAHRPRG